MRHEKFKRQKEKKNNSNSETVLTKLDTYKKGNKNEYRLCVDNKVYIFVFYNVSIIENKS